MKTMVERVAEAIYEAQRSVHPNWPSWSTIVKFAKGNPDSLSADKMNNHIEFARAAIAAMREPTEEMTRTDLFPSIYSSQAIQAWQAMIDEALK